MSLHDLITAYITAREDEAAVWAAFEATPAGSPDVGTVTDALADAHLATLRAGDAMNAEVDRLYSRSRVLDAITTAIDGGVS